MTTDQPAPAELDDAAWGRLRAHVQREHDKVAAHAEDAGPGPAVVNRALTRAIADTAALMDELAGQPDRTAKVTAWARGERDAIAARPDAGEDANFARWDGLGLVLAHIPGATGGDERRW